MSKMAEYQKKFGPNFGKIVEILPDARSWRTEGSPASRSPC
jgi:hypothetical protein